MVPAKAVRSAVFCTQAPELLQVLASGVARTAPEALFTCTLAQSYSMVSEQTTFTQNESCGLPAGSATVWLMLLLLEGLVPPTRAACVPPWAPLVTTEAMPAVVQPEREPVSKSPLVTTSPPPPPPAMVQLTEVVWLSEPLAPVTVTA